MKFVRNAKKIFTIASFLATAPMAAHHGSNIFLGGMMGAGIGAIAGGNDGVVPGLVTGLAVGTAAEIIDDAQDHHHCHHVVYTHESRPSRDWLEEQIEILEHKLYKAQQRNNQLEHELDKLDYELEKKDAEILHLQKEVKQFRLANHHDHETTEIILSAKTVSK